MDDWKQQIQLAERIEHSKHKDKTQTAEKFYKNQLETMFLGLDLNGTINVMNVGFHLQRRLTDKE